MENRRTGQYTDLTYLREIANGSDTFMIQMLNIFIEQTPQALICIDKALVDKDWKTLRLVVHKIKPSIMFAGLTEIRNDVSDLEEYAAEESHLEDIPILVDKIKKNCAGAIIELRDELNKIR